MWFIDRVTQKGHHFWDGVDRIIDLYELYWRGSNPDETNISYFTRSKATLVRRAQEVRHRYLRLRREIEDIEAQLYDETRSG